MLLQYPAELCTISWFIYLDERVALSEDIIIHTQLSSQCSRSCLLKTAFVNLQDLKELIFFNFIKSRREKMIWCAWWEGEGRMQSDLSSCVRMIIIGLLQVQVQGPRPLTANIIISPLPPFHSNVARLHWAMWSPPNSEKWIQGNILL